MKLEDLDIEITLRAKEASTDGFGHTEVKFDLYEPGFNSRDIYTELTCYIDTHNFAVLNPKLQITRHYAPPQYVWTIGSYSPTMIVSPNSITNNSSIFENESLREETLRLLAKHIQIVLSSIHKKDKYFDIYSDPINVKIGALMGLID